MNESKPQDILCEVEFTYFRDSVIRDSIICDSVVHDSVIVDSVFHDTVICDAVIGGSSLSRYGHS